MATYQIQYWYDIPLQVRARGEGGRGSAALHGRFQEAADQAAMSAGLLGSDDYASELQWSEPQDRDGTARDVAAAVAIELEAQFPTLDWHATAQALRARQSEHTEQTS